VKYLIFDSANILFRNWVTLEKEDPDRKGLAMHKALYTIRYWAEKFKPDQIVMAFEGGNNWRKEWTQSHHCVSGNQYKANRVYDPDMQFYFEFVEEFKGLVTNYTALHTLCVPGCEGDDVIAGFIELYSELHPGENEYVLVSSDRDFIQLKKYEGVTLINPANGLERDIDQKTGERIDPHYYLFEKCVRGDGGDGVFSAYPRVRATRIKKAFTDEYERVQFMNETWTNPKDGETYRVGDLFEENKILVGLDQQPDEIREKIFGGVMNCIENVGKFNNFQFMRLIGKYKLKEVNEDAHKFVNLLSGKLG
jgi:hypothetical protein